jgi:5-methylcytosine-specific restriction endonuclease McrA
MKLRIDPDKRSKALKYYHDNADKLRPLAAARAKAYYQKNKAKKQKQNALWRDKNKGVHEAMKKSWNKRRFFYCKAMMLKAHGRGGLCFETTQQLARGLMFQWLKQRGRCALTGIKLDRTANADHILPASKGGTDNSNNFQWLTPEANHFKGSLTLQELAHMCRLVLQNIEKRNLLTPTPLVAWPDTTALFYKTRGQKEAV